MPLMPMPPIPTKWIVPKSSGSFMNSPVASRRKRPAEFAAGDTLFAPAPATENQIGEPWRRRACPRRAAAAMAGEPAGAAGSAAISRKRRGVKHVLRQPQAPPASSSTPALAV